MNVSSSKSIQSVRGVTPVGPFPYGAFAIVQELVVKVYRAPLGLLVGYRVDAQTQDDASLDAEVEAI